MIEEYYSKDKHKNHKRQRPFSCFVKKGSRWQNAEEKEKKSWRNIGKGENLFSLPTEENEKRIFTPMLHKLDRYHRNKSSLPYQKHIQNNHPNRIQSSKQKAHNFLDRPSISTNNPNFMIDLQIDSISNNA